ncbi:hypothetical protein LC612_29345 [Nostoc sp. CHAB 5834]|nr:hypothetical protein [Nostoc sp. CHAB 5834]
MHFCDATDVSYKETPGTDGGNGELDSVHIVYDKIGRNLFFVNTRDGKHGEIFDDAADKLYEKLEAATDASMEALFLKLGCESGGDFTQQAIETFQLEEEFA